MSEAGADIFQSVKGRNKSESVVLQIEAAIAGKKFVPGDHLPSERRLQDLFQVSRGAIREALRTLRQKGLLETRKGARGGYYIKEVDINEAVEQLAMMIKQQTMPLDKLLEFQHAMDTGVLISAITNATPLEIKRLYMLAEQLEDLCQRSYLDFDKISVIDYKLNLLMVEMTKNPFFEWVMQTVQVSLRDYEFIVYQREETRLAVAQNWKATAEAIRNKDVQKALGLYGHWYVLLRQCLEKECKNSEQYETGRL